MQDYLRPDETPAEGVKRILLERVDYIHEQTLDPVEEREKVVHNARKSCKRIRALLRLVRDDLGEATYRRENDFYRDTSRLVAPLRDSAVLLEVLAGLEEDIPANLAEALREELTARHTRVSQQLLAEPDVMAQVAERMENGRSRLLALSLNNTGFNLLAPGIERIYRQGRRGMAAAYASNQPHAFHEWRKQVKYLWHHLEVVQPIWPSLLGVLIQDFNHLSDFLGDAHDLYQFAGALQAEEDDLGANADYDALLPLLAQRRHRLEQAARTLGQRLYAEKPSLFVARLSGYWSAWGEDMPEVTAVLNPQTED
jgi:CHAD domain-containing protein